MKAIDNALRDLKEEEIRFIGTTWQPVQGNDRRWRVVPFVVPIEGVKLNCYANHRAGGIPVNTDYIDSQIVELEGAKVLCKVPSATEKKPRYNVNLVSFPIKNNKEANAIILSLRSQYEEGKEPERVAFLHHLRYADKLGLKSSDVFVFDPHDVAAYLAATKKFWKGLENTVPLKMNPFTLPSKEFSNYYEKLNNQVVIYDPSLERSRNLHLDEKCILLARGIKVKGAWNTVFWDPQRDGNIKDYWK